MLRNPDPKFHDGPLSRDQVERFFDQGFLVLPGVYNDAEVREVKTAFERLEACARKITETQLHRGSLFVVDSKDSDPEVQDIRIHRVVWCGAAEPVLSVLGKHPDVLAISAQILGSVRMDQLINQAHFKLPGDGVSFPWHQDSLHRRYGTPLWQDVNGRGSFVEICTAVDAMGPVNGGIQVIPGSCKYGHIPVDPEDRSLPRDSFDVSKAIDVVVPAGGVFLIHPYVIHGSGINSSDRPRRLFLNGFAFPGANARKYPGQGSGRQVRALSRRIQGGSRIARTTHYNTGKIIIPGPKTTERGA